MSVTKYRMWDGKRMHQNREIKHYELGVLQGTSYKMMPFTGLLDKNGVEIYCGDIIKWEENTYRVYFGAHSTDDDDYYSKEAYGFFLCSDLETSMYGKEYSFKFNDIYEVIGSIYENPELLEVKR